MHRGIRFTLLLILAIALRGFAAPALAVPAAAQEPAGVVACHGEDQGGAGVMQAHHDAGDKACEISCDLAAAPALAAGLPPLLDDAPAALIPTRPVLALASSPPPDHPPPIR